MSAIKSGGVYCVINELSFFFVLAVHSLESTLFEQPLANQTDDVNAPRVWSVIKGFILDVGAIVEHCVKPLGNSLEQIVAHDHERDATWSHVFLRTCIDQRIFINRDWVREDVGRSIGNQRNRAYLRLMFPFNSLNGLIRSYVNVGCLWIEFQLITSRNACESSVRHGGCNVGGAGTLCLLQSFLSPAAGNDVVGTASRRQKIRRYH